MSESRFKLVLTEEADSFIKRLPHAAAKKMKLEGTEIWEFRTLFNKVKYRLFAFWDTEEETLVIATHGIIKKTQKTPAKEIAKAERIRQEYFKSKGE